MSNDQMRVRVCWAMRLIPASFWKPLPKAGPTLCWAAWNHEACLREHNYSSVRLRLEYHDLMSLFEFLDNGDGEITLTLVPDISA